MNKIEHLPNTGFYTYYPDGPIEKSLSLYQECGNSITLYFRDGTSQQVQVPSAYPLSPTRSNLASQSPCRFAHCLCKAGSADYAV